jgi:hypothetical protein
VIKISQLAKFISKKKKRKKEKKACFWLNPKPSPKKNFICLMFCFLMVGTSPFVVSFW